MEIYGLFLFAVGFLTMAMIYAVASLGVNINWGFTGLFNVGVAGFFAVGAYSSAVLTAPESVHHIGGFGLPVPVGILAAMVLAALVAWPIGKICLRLRSDYLAIATIGIAEILRVTFRNYQPLGGGPFGVNNIPRPFESLPTPWDQIAFLLLVVAIVGVILFLVQRAWTAPWGRVLRAIRENEDAAEAAGKDVEKFRLQAFILGSMLMGLFGALMAHYVKIISPEGTEPLLVTFLPWVMLIVGGAGNNRGAVVGAILVWGLWTMTELLTGRLPDEWALRVGYLRIFLIGLLLQIVLQKFPGGLLPERPPTVPRD